MDWELVVRFVIFGLWGGVISYFSYKFGKREGFNEGLDYCIWRIEEGQKELHEYIKKREEERRKAGLQ